MSLVSATGNLAATYGRAVTLRQTTGGTYDPVTRTYTGGSTTTTGFTALVGGFTEEELAAGGVSRGDLKCILPGDAVAASGVTPRDGDVIELDGTRYRVQMLGVVWVGSNAAAYRLALRGIA